MPSLNDYLILSAVLFTIGTAGVFVRRNLITILLSIEIMLNAVNLTFVAFSSKLGQISGQIFVFFVLVVAAAEAAVGLALYVRWQHRKEATFKGRNMVNAALVLAGLLTVTTWAGLALMVAGLTD